MREHNLEGGRPPCDWDDPTDRDRLISELVDDANELVWAAEDLEARRTKRPSPLSGESANGSPLREP